MHLPGLYVPLVFDTLTGLVAYHPRDSAFAPYARVMRFILRYYDVHAKLRRGQSVIACRHDIRTHSRGLSAREVA